MTTYLALDLEPLSFFAGGLAGAALPVAGAVVAVTTGGAITGDGAGCAGGNGGGGGGVGGGAILSVCSLFFPMMAFSSL